MLKSLAAKAHLAYRRVADLTVADLLIRQLVDSVLELRRLFDTRSEDLIGSIIDGEMLKATDITTGGVSIAHNLKRQPKGWLIADIKSTSTIGGHVERVSWNTAEIKVKRLGFDANPTVMIWIW